MMLWECPERGPLGPSTPVVPLTLGEIKAVSQRALDVVERVFGAGFSDFCDQLKVHRYRGSHKAARRAQPL
jgi:hypothetical protein